MARIYEALAEIVGKEYISDQAEELFIYSRDPGTMDPKKPDYVVLPRTTEEVQAVIHLANREKVPVVPLGGGLALSGLSRPLKAGIVLDMKRMNKILEVNEKSRYVVVEAGVSQGMLQAYLKKNYPHLKHSIPDSPPAATIAGNVLIHGSGHLSQATGFHSEMLNGMEVVLPTGEICKVGSCSATPYWFSRAPLPDLAGLFLGWHGTTGVVTKLAIKLYPNPALKDVMIFLTENPDHMPDILFKVTGTEMVEDLNVSATQLPDYMEGLQLTLIYVTANTSDELAFKERTIRETLRSYIDEKEGGFMVVPTFAKGRFLEAPLREMTKFSDTKKGGGFEYVGAIMPIELFPKAYRKGVEIAAKYDTPYSMAIRIIGRAHCMMFAYAYAFNRADENDRKNAQRALHESNTVALEMGGIPWKAEEPAQQLILKQMNPETIKLMNKIRAVLDPNGIMNPGNWEVR
ncbi:MAG: FAD-binding oxidoreductase [Candidatus Abyssobacteria bacterium SURF_17]|uniref:FAD-binding oxidoreductase n=1 Tax=Candidatus Abyssobacteria bacterium SURF_17 TaxID=2093361 RepID=A0A419F9W9_9BACT|nr:MAG: FAD-binding oxidoreductase [Candidatus Abyssubacteria bacterium SURF_17]